MKFHGTVAELYGHREQRHNYVIALIFSNSIANVALSRDHLTKRLKREWLIPSAGKHGVVRRMKISQQAASEADGIERLRSESLRRYELPTMCTSLHSAGERYPSLGKEEFVGPFRQESTVSPAL